MDQMVGEKTLEIKKLISEKFMSIKDLFFIFSERNEKVSETRIKQIIKNISRNNIIQVKKEKNRGRLRDMYYIGPHTEHDASCAELNRKIA